MEIFLDILKADKILNNIVPLEFYLKKQEYNFNACLRLLLKFIGLKKSAFNLNVAKNLQICIWLKKSDWVLNVDFQTFDVQGLNNFQFI